MQEHRPNYYIISSDEGAVFIFKKLLNTKGEIFVFEKGRIALDRVLHTPPALIVLDVRIEDISAFEFVRLVKGENVYLQIPVVLCLEQEIPPILLGESLFEVEIDDFILRPIREEEARVRIELTLLKSTKFLDANPLTKLPGNTTIIQKIQSLIEAGKDFALGYVDLDYFKSFNDKYGFSRGDEVLMMTARIIVNIVKEICGSEGFVGHIGGDDFVFIAPKEKAEEICKEIVKNFDEIVPYFYDPQDKKQGFIISVNRQGKVEKFPLMAISIGVVFNERGRLRHYGEASQIAVNLKKMAKKSSKSSYILDRRTYE